MELAIGRGSVKHRPARWGTLLPVPVTVTISPDIDAWPPDKTKAVGGAFAAPTPPGTVPYGGSTDPPCGGTDPDFRFKGMTLKIKLRSFTDGTSKTFLVGEKTLPQKGYGLATFGDSSIYNDDEIIHLVRWAGPNSPLALNDDEIKSAYDAGTQRFGSAHPGICQFVFADGHVGSINVSIDTVPLGYLAERADGEIVTDN